MKTLILADLHDDDSTFFGGPGPLVGCEDVLEGVEAVILAGDVTNQAPKRWPGAIGRVREVVGDVPIHIFPGNHELYWAYDDLFADDTLLREAASCAGATYAQMADFIIGDTQVLAATLWTDMKLASGADREFIVSRKGLLDYQNIPRREEGGWRTLRHEDTTSRHEQHLDWLAKRLAQAKTTKQRVVVTHHSPVPFELGHGRADSAYGSDLIQFIEETGPDAWYFGHTHRPGSWMIGATEVRNMSFGRPHQVRDRKAEILQRLIVEL